MIRNHDTKEEIQEKPQKTKFSIFQGALSQNEDNTTPLVEACRNRDLTMVDLLLKHGARDDDCKALSVVVGNKDDILTAKLLSIKAFPDPEHRINKKSMSENLPAMQFGGITGLTYSSLFADTPVMINWHCQKCQLSKIKPQWLVRTLFAIKLKCFKIMLLHKLKS